uniref:Uncharacterized protein n=1 Tax=Pseudodiaptomus poplesia TaxID=213370 RepID=A0A1S6GLC4_9MAXI|nr:hypothetical protein [Pseudodiaptomus poplesia]
MASLEANTEVLLKKLTVAINQWKLNIKKGNDIISDVISRLYPTEKEGPALQLAPDFRDTAAQLTAILNQLQRVLADVEAVGLEYSGVLELTNLSTSSLNSSRRSSSHGSSFSLNSPSSLSSPFALNSSVGGLSQSFIDTSSTIHSGTLLEINKTMSDVDEVGVWVQTIVDCYRQQFSLAQSVVSNIFHLKSREEALYHQTVWLLQPALSSDCELYQVCCSEIVRPKEDSLVKKSSA